MSSQILSIEPSGPRQGSGLFPIQTWQTIAKSLGLSPREMQILQRIFDDQTEQTIASSLEISPHTVNTYVQRLYQKLGVASRAQAIVHVVAYYISVEESRGRMGQTALA